MKHKTISLSRDEMETIQEALRETLCESHQLLDELTSNSTPWYETLTERKKRVVMCALKLTSKNGYGDIIPAVKRLRKKLKKGG